MIPRNLKFNLKAAKNFLSFVKAIKSFSIHFMSKIKENILEWELADKIAAITPSASEGR